MTPTNITEIPKARKISGVLNGFVFAIVFVELLTLVESLVAKALDMTVNNEMKSVTIQ